MNSTFSLDSLMANMEQPANTENVLKVYFIL